MYTRACARAPELAKQSDGRQGWWRTIQISNGIITAAIIKCQASANDFCNSRAATISPTICGCWWALRVNVLFIIIMPYYAVIIDVVACLSSAASYDMRVMVFISTVKTIDVWDECIWFVCGDMSRRSCSIKLNMWMGVLDSYRREFRCETIFSCIYSSLMLKSTSFATKSDCCTIVTLRNCLHHTASGSLLNHFREKATTFPWPSNMHKSVCVWITENYFVHFRMNFAGSWP